MELGSTICTPKPKCVECPIRKTCRVYAEGEGLLVKESAAAQLPDIEDACTLCQQLDVEDLAAAPEGDDETDKKFPEKPTKKRKIEQNASNRISNYFIANTTKPKTTVAAQHNEAEDIVDAITSKKRKTATTTTAQTKSIATYCSIFPKKMPKKKVPEEEVVVCILEARLANGRRKWLIEQRPAKGTVPTHALLQSVAIHPQTVCSCIFYPLGGILHGS